MKPACLLLILCALCGAQTKNAKPAKSTAFADSALAAYDSIRSLDDNADAPDIGFQPRQIEAEKNLATAGHKVKTDEDRRQFEILKTWMQMVNSQRGWEIAQAQTKYPDLQVKYAKASLNFLKARLACSVEADAIFNPSTLTEKQKKIVDQHKCIGNAKDANDSMSGAVE